MVLKEATNVFGLLLSGDRSVVLENKKKQVLDPLIFFSPWLFRKDGEIQQFSLVCQVKGH